MTAPTVPLICPQCQQPAAYVIGSTLVTCQHCGGVRHVTYYDTMPVGQGDANFALPLAQNRRTTP